MGRTTRTDNCAFSLFGKKVGNNPEQDHSQVVVSNHNWTFMERKERRQRPLRVLTAQGKNRVKDLSGFFWSSCGLILSLSMPWIFVYINILPPVFPSAPVCRDGRAMVAVLRGGEWDWGRNFSVVSSQRSRCLLLPGLGDKPEIYSHAPEGENTLLTKRVNRVGRFQASWQKKKTEAMY